MIPIETSWSLGHIETFGSTESGDGWRKYMTMRCEVRGKGVWVGTETLWKGKEKKKGMQQCKRRGGHGDERWREII